MRKEMIRQALFVYPEPLIPCGSRRALSFVPTRTNQSAQLQMAASW
jgi:hypothetical protein